MPDGRWVSDYVAVGGQSLHDILTHESIKVIVICFVCNQTQYETLLQKVQIQDLSPKKTVTFLCHALRNEHLVSGDV